MRRTAHHGRARRGSHGLTLLELLIVIGILVLMIGIGVSSLSSIGTTQLRTQTNRLAAAMRYAYSRAVASGNYLRLVIDIDADRYWVEASEEPVFLSRDKRKEGLDPNAKDEDEDTDKKKRQGKHDEEAPATGKTAYAKDDIIPEIAMERGIGIDGVLTSNQEDVFRHGKAYIHFFPNGFVEPAMIYTTDGDSGFYTLSVHPWTGKVTSRVGKLDPDREFGRPADEEQEGR